MSEFTFRAFLRDRRVYILTYVAVGFLTAAVVQLDLWLSGSSLRYANVLYIMVLGLVGLIVFLTLDYRRQSRFFRQLTRSDDQPEPDRLTHLGSAVTLEQQLYADAWARLYSRLSTVFSEERHRTERRVHFLSQWAHHMKTPVAVIDLELQKARKNPATASEPFLQSIAEENERLSHSLQALLSTIRLDDFTSDFKVEPVNLPSLARQVVNDYRHAFIAHGVYPKIEQPSADAIPEQLLTVESDAKWLRLIVEQVISNAIKYASGLEREGRVTLRFVLEGGSTLLEVTDNGIGIPPEDLGRVFDPFFTGRAGRDHASSTGLGLYLAREASERLGHTLAIQSAPGKGTTVRIGFQRDTSIFADVKRSLTVK